MREKGLTENGYRVKAFGTDMSPNFQTLTSSGIAIKKQDNKYWAKDEGKWKQLQITKGGDLKTNKFRIEGREKLDPFIRKALDSAQAKWEDITVGAKGMETGFESRFEQ